MAQQQPPSPEPSVNPTLPVPYARRRRKSSGGPKWLRRLTKKSALRRNLTRILVLLLVIVVIGAVGFAVVLTSTINQVESSIDNLTRVVSSIQSNTGDGLTSNDFDRLSVSLIDVISTFGSAYDRGQLLLSLPIASSNIEFKTNLTQLGAGEQVARAAYSIMSGLEPTLNFLLGEQNSSSDPLVMQISTGERLVELLSIGRPSFVQAAGYLDNAQALLDTIDTTQLSSSLLVQLEQIRSYESLLSDLQSILVESPDLLTSALGIGGESSYLVLAANSDEIRPSGGYLSTYGWLLVRNGRVEDYNYSASTATSPNPPLASVEQIYPPPDWWIPFGNPVYAAWDGSWTPDFPTTAEMAMWYYNSGNNPRSPMRGVISIDIVAFEYILEALQSVYVPEYNTTVTSSSFRDVVYEIRATGENLEHKRFLAAVYRQIFDDWQTRASDPEFSSQILTVLLRALQEKHLMLYSSSEEITHALDVLGWSGRQIHTDGEDYLMLVDANMGNKSNSSVRRQVIYDVELTPEGSANSRVTVLYDYSASTAENDPAVDANYHGPLDYTSLFQLYTPAGSTLSDSSGGLNALQTVSGDVFTQFIAFLTVPYDTSERYQFSYNVPDVTPPLGTYSRYTLRLQKQPGMRAELAIVQVTLPQGSYAVRTTPNPTANYNIERQILEFRMDFRSDVMIDIVYRSF